jgi:capsular polysaccharide export protein
MSKLRKLTRTPSLFFFDLLAKRLGQHPKGQDAEDHEGDNAHQQSDDGDDAITTFVFGFSPWKSFLRDWFPERKLVFFPKLPSPAEKKRILMKMAKDQNVDVFVWGLKCDQQIISEAKKNGNKVYYIEDGFIRSVGLGASKTPPLSLTIDTRAPYFSSRTETDLEKLLNEYNFLDHPELLERARRIKNRLLNSGLSKYNNSPNVAMEEVYAAKTNKRVLVIGQVEDDASILYGCKKGYKNNDLVLMAALENPEAQIIYKPHPDVLAKHRAAQTDPNDVSHIAHVLAQPISLANSFHGVDQVYTITSLAGFEALLRGIKVTCLGAPFYSGWGVTDDRQEIPRRQRSLTVDEIFAAAYILYPRYFDPIKREAIQIEDAVDLLLQLRALDAKRAFDETDAESVALSEIGGEVPIGIREKIDRIYNELHDLKTSIERV